jgi:hypothetical protein
LTYKLISYKDIDQRKWDELLKSSNQSESQYATFWYISSVSNCWSAFVLGDYIAAFPFAHEKKAGFELVYQPFFTRSFPFLGQVNDDFISYVFHYFKKHFRHLNINLLNEVDFSFLSVEKRVFQQLNLNQEYSKIQESFSKNAIRILNKNQNLKIEKSSELNLFISLFKETVGKRLKYKTENYQSLSSLIQKGLNNNCIEFLHVKSNDEVLAYGVFYHHKNVLNFLKGAATNNGKKNGAMYVLINELIQKNCMTEKILDFGGSNVENVSNFYKKFGANDVVYNNYSFDSLPKIIKKLKNIRTKLLK